ncbi:M48 family metalloprotease [Amaricoccus solimangrovi]|nr:M48 family metalloprotease [Amaricoccus solimangrovi]
MTTIATIRARASSLVLCIFVAGCGAQGYGGPTAAAPEAAAPASAYPTRSRADFGRVAARVEAATKSVCAERTGPARPGSCDFDFVLAVDPAAPPNAFQSRSADGRPTITLTSSLLAQLRDDDEIATVLAHEAAHHVAGHIARANDPASAEAFLLGAADAKAGGSTGGDRSTRLERARALELEADWIGAFIAERSGYAPEKGAEIFRRAAARRGSPSRMSSHPDPSRRLEVISAAVAEIHRERSAGLTPSPENAPVPLP